MRSPQLHALGFDFRSTDALVKAAFAAGVQGINTAPGFELIGHHTDPSGARLSFIRRKGAQPDIAGGLVSTTIYRAQVIRFTDRLARVAVYSRDDEGRLLGEFIAMVDDPIAYPQYDLSGSQFTIVQALQVAALAIDVQVLDDEAAFASSGASRLGPVEVEPTHLFSPGLIGLKENALIPVEVTPTLLMGVVVEAVEVRRNTLTDVDFQYVTGRSGFEIACGIAMDTPVAPGNVVHGTWFATVNSGTWDRADGAH